MGLDEKAITDPTSLQADILAVRLTYQFPAAFRTIYLGLQSQIVGYEILAS